VFDLTVDSINDAANRSVAGGQLRPAEPEFTRVVQTIRKAQIQGAAGIRVEREKDKPDSVAFVFRTQNIDPDLARELDEVRKMLHLDPKASEFRVVFGADTSRPNEIAILSRSVLRILSELSASVDVPVEDLASGSAPSIGEQPGDAEPSFHVLSADQKPCDPFVAVCYEGHWFWIEKSDFRSKRTLSYLLVLLALADTGAKENLPVITIPAN
jgi:hypothetical protein